MLKIPKFLIIFPLCKLSKPLPKVGTTNPGGQESAKSVDPLTVLTALCVNLLVFHYLRRAVCQKRLGAAIIFALSRQG